MNITTTQAIVTIVSAVLLARPPTLLALATLRQSRRSHEETVKNTAITKATAEIVEVTDKKIDHVTELTNSNLSVVTADRDGLALEIKALRELVTKLYERSNGGALADVAKVAAMKTEPPPC